jgi:hypothetical protein
LYISFSRASSFTAVRIMGAKKRGNRSPSYHEGLIKDTRKICLEDLFLLLEHGCSQRTKPHYVYEKRRYKLSLDEEFA